MKHINSEGSFDCIVTMPTAGWIGESEEKQTPFIRIPVQVTDDGVEKGAGAVWQGWLSQGAFDKTIKRLVEVFGFNGDLAALATGHQTFVGQPCAITTVFEEYNGKKRCKVQWLNAIGGGTKPMEQSKLEALLARLTPEAIKVAKMAGKEPNPNAVTDTDSAPDSVPF